MGVSITAYSKVSLIDNPKRDEFGDFEGDCVDVSFGDNLPHFSEQADDLKEEQVYEYKNSKSTSMAYSSFNRLRNSLAKLAGYKPNPELSSYPYYDGVFLALRKGNTGLLKGLMLFPDCEGEIGNKTCNAILNDLLLLSNRKSELHEYDQIKFEQLVDLFKLASDGGFVKFT